MEVGGSSSLCFVCVHMAAHRENVEARNAEYKVISTRPIFADTTGRREAGPLLWLVVLLCSRGGVLRGATSRAEVAYPLFLCLTRRDFAAARRRPRCCYSAQCCSCLVTFAVRDRLATQPLNADVPVFGRLFFVDVIG